MILPPVLSIDHQTDGRIVLALALREDHPAFAGHFPGQPILPGVVQLDWAIRLGAEHFNLGLRAATDFQVKYRRIIQPQAALSLTLQLDRAKGSLAFTYRAGDEVASSGRIKLEPAP